jgi:metal-responsive CopG/Arc/MetJ family transcriptional regulator
MTTISLALPSELLTATDVIAGRLHMSRAAYIRMAIVRLNDAMTTQMRADRLTRASERVRRDSMRVNAEFEAADRKVE